MPLPSPRRNENESDFVGRCMEELAGEFPDSDQRVAVCETQWRDRTNAMPHEILIYGPIGMGYGMTAEEIKSALAVADGQILVRINSAGGSFDEGPAIYNALKGYSGDLDTEVDGIAYSMASVILQAGRTRRMAANSVLMVHGAQYFAEGSAEDMRKTAEMMDTHTEAMISAFVGRGIPEATVRSWLTDGDDHYFSAQEALEAGLIDEISDAVDMAAALQRIPADIPLPSSLAAYRNPREEETTMPDNQATETTASGNQASTGVDINAFNADRNKNIRRGEQAGREAEAKRQAAIRAFFDRPQFTDPQRLSKEDIDYFADLRDRCLSDFGTTPDRARDLALDAMDGIAIPVIAVDTQTQAQSSSFGNIQTPPTASRPSARNIQAGADAKDKYVEGVTAALLVKTGLETDKEKRNQAQENEFVSMSCYEMARRYLDVNNIQITSSRREQIIGQAMVMGAGIAHSTSDFANLLENVANKALMMGWDEAPETWDRWARSGTLPDFKEGSRVNLSTFGDLDIIYENGEYKYGSFSDLKEKLQLATYGKLFGISRQALANDDLSALSSIPRNMGRAAARKIGDLAYNALITNPVLNQDNTAVFDATHNNLGTAGPPDVAPGGTLDEAWTSMGLQTDPAGNVLNIMPVHLLVPRALEISTASMIADATYHYASAAQERQNPFQNRLTVTSDARLDTDSATQWYVLASGTMHDTVEVAFLNGQQTPYLESKEGWRVDGVEYKVRIDAVAIPLDYRTMFRNAGA